MPKNITIKEDGTAKPMSSVSMLNLKLQSGGGSDWVPEDETPLAKIDITHNGEYVASADGYYGYGLVRVNVAGGAGAEQSGTAPTNIEGGYTVSDYDPAIDVQPYEFQQPDIGGIGSSIMGIDPITGGFQMAYIDENGNLVMNNDIQPAKLHIGRLPDKLTYNEGDTIDYGGIKCYLLTEDNHVFNVGKYSKEVAHEAGLVPFNELSFPTTIAHGSSDGSDGVAYTDKAYGGTVPIFNPYGNSGNGPGLFSIAYRYRDNHGNYGASVFTFDYPDNEETSGWSTYTKEGKSVKDVYSTGAIPNLIDGDNFELLPDKPKKADGSDWENLVELAWYIMYSGNIVMGSSQLPVRYTRSDGVTLEATFGITVTPDGGFGGGGGGGAF